MVKKTYFCDICGKEVEQGSDLCTIDPTVGTRTTVELQSCWDCIGTINKAIDETILELSHGNLIIERE